MYIGKAAKLTGASPKAIRLYESLGLLPPVQRAGEYRVYDEADILAIRMIRQAQQLGFRLSELAALKDVHQQPEWLAVLALIERKREALAAELLQLQCRDAQLKALADELRSCPGVMADCSATLAEPLNPP